MFVRTVLFTTFTLFALSGCAFVEKTPGGKKVRVLSKEEVTTCRKLGKTSTSVLASVAGVARPPETIAQELETIGRNSGFDMGGDTIVAESDVEDGKRTFGVYKCVDPNATE